MAAFSPLVNSDLAPLTTQAGKKAVKDNTSSSVTLIRLTEEIMQMSSTPETVNNTVFYSVWAPQSMTELAEFSVNRITDSLEQDDNAIWTRAETPWRVA